MALKDEARLSVMDKYALEIVSAGVLLLLSWTAFTTYQNALYAKEISGKLDGFAVAAVRIENNIDDVDDAVDDLQRRVVAVESSRWSYDDQKDFIKWIEAQLEKKQDK